MVKRRILITGGTGRLGKTFDLHHKHIPRDFSVELPERKDFDICDTDSMKRYLIDSPLRPGDVVIHCAAYTGIPPCEKNKGLAWDTNVNGTRRLLDLLPEGVHFIYMSTPCVFSGEEGGYDEHSIPNPCSFYGLTKLVGEQITLQSETGSGRRVVTRANFVPFEKWPHPAAFTDRFGTYLFSRQVTEFLLKLTDEIEHCPSVMHICGSEKISMYDLAKITTPSVGKMTLDDWDGPALARDMSLQTNFWMSAKILRGDDVERQD